VAGWPNRIGYCAAVAVGGRYSGGEQGSTG